MRQTTNSTLTRRHDWRPPAPVPAPLSVSSLYTPASSVIPPQSQTNTDSLLIKLTGDEPPEMAREQQPPFFSFDYDIAPVRGPTGERGPPGPPGRGDIIVDYNPLVHTITWSNGTVMRLPPGNKGDKGDKGDRGDTIVDYNPVEGTILWSSGALMALPRGLQGPKGDSGKEGREGRRGRDGNTGPCGGRGPTGATGAQGPGISDLCIDHSGRLLFTVNAQRYQASGTLVAPTGPAGATGAAGATGERGPVLRQLDIDTSGRLVATLSDGMRIKSCGSVVAPTGATGARGDKGEAGKCPRIVNAYVHENRLVMRTDDGADVPVSGYVWGLTGERGERGPAGEPGASLEALDVLSDGRLVATIGGRRVAVTGRVRGPTGERGERGPAGEGERGPTGKAAPSLVQARLTSVGKLCLTMSDGRLINVQGTVCGPTGPEGHSVTSMRVDEKGRLHYTVNGKEHVADGALLYGPTGSSGRGVESIRLDEDGRLFYKLEASDAFVAAGRVPTGPTGRNAPHIESIHVDKSNRVVVTTSDKKRLVSHGYAWGVTGSTGEKGEKGDRGMAGPGIARVRVTDTGVLLYTVEGGAEVAADGVVVGVTGATGPVGPPGPAPLIESIFVDSGNRIVMQTADGRRHVSKGCVHMHTGPTGSVGPTGTVGAGISTVRVDSDGRLFYTLDCNGNAIKTEHRAEGRVVGLTGPTGAPAPLVDSLVVKNNRVVAQMSDGRRIVAQGYACAVTGPTGVSVRDVCVDTDARVMVVTLSDGTRRTCGSLFACTGPTGPVLGIQKLALDAEHRIELTTSDGAVHVSEYPVPRGVTGPQGERGPMGERGPGVRSVRVTESGRVVVGLDTGANVVAEGCMYAPTGPRGPKGATGERGSTGEKGERGCTGERGPGIMTARFHTDGTLYFGLTDSTSVRAKGRIVAPTGATGAPGRGERGHTGPQGMQGRGIDAIHVVNDDLVFDMSDATVIRIPLSILKNKLN